MRAAINISIKGASNGKGGPFGAAVVKDGVIISCESNQVTTTNDPTAHAEVMAIRKACEKLGTFQLEGCEIYCSCEPCPMCLGAIYWARPDRVFFANTKADAAKIGFDDQFIYDEIEIPLANRRIPMLQMMREEGLKAFELWEQIDDKTLY